MYMKLAMNYKDTKFKVINMDEITNLIMNNERLIYSIANYFKNYNSKEDLYQAGCLGLITAYKKYNPNMNCKFTTYAYPYILGEMRKLVREDKGMKVSREITKLNLKIEKEINSDFNLISDSK